MSFTVLRRISVTTFLSASDIGSAPVSELFIVWFTSCWAPTTNCPSPNCEVDGLDGWKLKNPETSLPWCSSLSRFVNFINLLRIPLSVNSLSLSEITPTLFGRSKSSRFTPSVMLLSFWAFASVSIISFLVRENRCHCKLTEHFSWVQADPATLLQLFQACFLFL